MGRGALRQSPHASGVGAWSRFWSGSRRGGWSHPAAGSRPVSQRAPSGNQAASVLMSTRAAVGSDWMWRRPDGRQRQLPGAGYVCGICHGEPRAPNPPRRQPDWPGSPDKVRPRGGREGGGAGRGPLSPSAPWGGPPGPPEHGRPYSGARSISAHTVLRGTGPSATPHRSASASTSTSPRPCSLSGGGECGGRAGGTRSHRVSVASMRRVRSPSVRCSSSRKSRPDTRPCRTALAASSATSWSAVSATGRVGSRSRSHTAASSRASRAPWREA